MVERRSADSIETLRSDVSSHARTITEIIKEQQTVREYIQEIKTDRAVRTERDKNMNGRFDRVETRINEVDKDVNKRFDDLISVIKWALFVFLGALIAGFATFIVRGGMFVG